RPARKDARRVCERLEVALAADVASASDAVALQQLAVEDLEVVTDRVDAERVGVIDPAVAARRMDLHGHERVEVATHGLDVGAEEPDAAVLALEPAGVEPDELAHALVECGAHGLEDVRHRHDVALDRARALAAEPA